MLRRILMLSIAAVCAATAQKYSGPRPPKPDLVYIKHAENLLPTESAEAKEEKGKKDDVLYIIAGANSSAKTPLASPIFLFQSDKLEPDKLQLFKLESKGGRREILFAVRVASRGPEHVEVRVAPAGGRSEVGMAVVR